jgi:hypothetical protein
VLANDLDSELESNLAKQKDVAEGEEIMEQVYTVM